MNRAVRIASTVLVVCAGIAFGVVAMTGVVAAVVFPTTRDLDPTLPDYAAYSGPHWSLAAGILAERVFQVGFLVIGVALAGALISVVLLAIGRRGGGGFPAVRVGLTLLTLGIFFAHVGWLQPRMDDAAGAYRAAALVGDNDAAGEAKARFDSMHPTASRLIGATTFAAFALFVVSAWAASGGSSHSRPGERTGES
ncbi:MAG: hypothetical protein Q9O74_11700 [Planctomycetota bacterium]|nr:hypothetical protein [Planctomycetota bacterium]